MNTHLRNLKSEFSHRIKMVLSIKSLQNEPRVLIIQSRKFR